MNLHAFLCAGALALGPVGFAAAEPASSPAKVAGAVTPVAPSAARLALARQVFEAMGGQTSVERLLHGMAGQVPTLLAKAPAKQQEKVTGLVQFVSERMAYYHPQIVQAVEGIYAQEFTDDQLRAILSFYQTPAGRLLAEKSSRIDALSLVAALPVLKRLMADVNAHQKEMKDAAPPASPAAPPAHSPTPSPPKP